MAEVLIYTMSGQVVLMWLRTTVNHQYRNGGTFKYIANII